MTDSNTKQPQGTPAHALSALRNISMLAQLVERPAQQIITTFGGSPEERDRYNSALNVIVSLATVARALTEPTQQG